MYLPSANVLKVLACSIVLIAISNLTGAHLLVAIGKEKICFYSVLVGIFFNIITNLVLIPAYGALGAGVATLLSEFSVAVCEFFFVRKFFLYAYILKNVIQCIFSVLVMCITVLVVLHFNLSGILSIGVSVCLGMIIYFFVLLLFRNDLFIEQSKKVIERCKNVFHK